MQELSKGVEVCLENEFLWIRSGNKTGVWLENLLKCQVLHIFFTTDTFYHLLSLCFRHSPFVCVSGH